MMLRLPPAQLTLFSGFVRRMIAGLTRTVDRRAGLRIPPWWRGPKAA